MQTERLRHFFRNSTTEAELHSKQKPMPTLLTHAPETPPPPVPPRKRWTRVECGTPEMTALFERDRLELVEGELISKMGKHRAHVNAFRLMHFWLLEAFGPGFIDVEAPIDVNPSDNALSEPVPDITVLNRECATIVSGNIQPQDILLLVEISDSTLNYDLTVKGPLYARAKILEYWVIDVVNRRLISHRNPVSGKYTSIVIYNEGEAVNPLAAPHLSFSAAQVLPPA
jgi:hypothetical protein